MIGLRRTAIAGRRLELLVDAICMGRIIDVIVGPQSLTVAIVKGQLPVFAAAGR